MSEGARSVESEPAKNAGSNVLLEERSVGGVVTLRLNRPEKLNALNPELGRALAKALAHLATDDTARVIVITGAGRGFCSGGDLNFLRESHDRKDNRQLQVLLTSGKEICLSIPTMPKPVLAAVNGPAAGGGMNLALACDLRIASDQATFGETFANLGLYPDFGGTYFLPRIVGRAHAVQLFLTGEMIPASEALRIGIVNRVVPADKLETETRLLAERLASAPPMTMRSIKRALEGEDRKTLEQMLEEEIRLQLHCFHSADAAEGFAAFFEKRRPQFHGH